MSFFQFILEGTRPAALVGFLMVLLVGLVAFRSKQFTLQSMVVIGLGGLLSGLPFISSAEIGKDGLKLKTAVSETVDAAKSIGEDLKKFREETGGSIRAINSQVADLGNAQKRIADIVAKLAAAPTSAASSETAAELKSAIDATNAKMSEIQSRNNNLAESIELSKPALTESITRLNNVQRRLMRE